MERCFIDLFWKCTNECLKGYYFFPNADEFYNDLYLEL